MNKLRLEIDHEPKSAAAILKVNPHGWAAVHAVLVSAARQLAGGARNLTVVARRALDEVTSPGLCPSPDRKLPALLRDADSWPGKTPCT